MSQEEEEIHNIPHYHIVGGKPWYVCSLGSGFWRFPNLGSAIITGVMGGAMFSLIVISGIEYAFKSEKQ